LGVTWHFRHSRSHLVATANAILLSAACACGSGDAAVSPTALVMTKPGASGDAQAGSVAQPLPAQVVVAVSRNGAPVADVEVVWSILSGGGSAQPATTTTAADGTARTTWTLGTTAGPQSLRATATGTSASPVTFTATAAAGPAASISVLSGGGQSAATGFALPLPLVVRVRDQHANPVTGTTVQWSVVAGLASPAPTSSVSDAGGNAQTVVTVGAAAGSVSIAATADGLAGSPATFTATAVAPAEFTAEVDVRNNAFQPSTVTIPAGSRVRWTWRNTGGVIHNVTSTGQPSFPSSAASISGDGSTYQQLFATAGTYRYECTLHAGMTGMVIVQ
jgi:plastocyanin